MPKEILEKNQSHWRWIILVLACLMMVGSYYCFDIPAAIKTQIDDYMGDPSDYEIQFGLLYTLYSAPNVILPFFGGYLVDRIGVRMCLLLFSSLIAVGQVIFALGLSLKSWPVMFLGRLIFGFGGESFTVANSALLAQWFKGKELAFAFGVNLSISKLGSVVNNLVSPILTDQVSILFALWFGAILCAVCVGCVLVTIPIDISVEQQILRNAKEQSEDQTNKTISFMHGSDKALEAPTANKEDSQLTVQPADEASLKDVFKFKFIFWILVVSCMVVYGCVLPFNNISSSLLLERDYFKEVPSGCAITDPRYCEAAVTNPYTAACSSSQWVQPPLPNNATVSGEVYSPLQTSDIDCTDDAWKDNCATSLYCDRLTKAESQTSVIMSIPYIISACLSPPLGYVIDLYGFRAVIAAVAPAVLIIVHMTLALSKDGPIGPLVGQGLAYTGFVSVLWPSVPLVVEERETGLAFGVVTSAQNLATAVIPLLAASIYTDSGDHYIPNVELLFVALAAVGFLVGLYLNVFDWTHGHHLNGPLWPWALSRVCLVPCGCTDEVIEYHAAPTLEEGEDSATEVHLAAPLMDERAPHHEAMPRPGSRTTSVDVHHGHRTRSHGGSFTSYEEALRGGAFRNTVESELRKYSFSEHR